MQDLLERIQASEVEIKDHLETIHACQIDGKVIRLPPDSRFSCFASPYVEYLFLLQDTGECWTLTTR